MASTTYHAGTYQEQLAEIVGEVVELCLGRDTLEPELREFFPAADRIEHGPYMIADLARRIA